MVQSGTSWEGEDARRGSLFDTQGRSRYQSSDSTQGGQEVHVVIPEDFKVVECKMNNSVRLATRRKFDLPS